MIEIVLNIGGIVMRRISTFFLFAFIVFAVSSISISAQEERGEPARIFALNFFSGSVDLRVGGEEDFVFKRTGLKSGWAALLTDTSDFGRYRLFFRSSAENEWFIWSRDGKDQLLRVEPGNIYLILVRNDGTLGYYSLDDTDTGQPHVMFANATDKTMKRMEVSYGWMTETGRQTTFLDPNGTTHFVAISEGTYHFYWHAEEYGRTYYTYSSEGQPAPLPLRNNNYYVFGAITVDGEDVGFGYNITP
jgi:hypothetical protein